MLHSFIGLDPAPHPLPLLFLLAQRNVRKSHKSKSSVQWKDSRHQKLCHSSFSFPQDAVLLFSCIPNSPRSILLCVIQRISGTYLFPFRAFFANTDFALEKLVFSCWCFTYLLSIHLRCPSRKVFLFDFQIKSQVKTNSFLFSVAVSTFCPLFPHLKQV